MQDDIARFVRRCLLCCISNPSNRKQGLYHAFPIPMRTWEIISMEFMGDLPTTKKEPNYLFEVVDRFNKMCIPIFCKNTIKGH